eukprot:c22305_g2_i1 orf=539-3184(+)
MFWRMAGLSTTSPVESLLDKDGFTLEELLDEDELIQECKSLNTRLINFLRGKSQIQQLLKYVVEEPPEGSDNKRAFKFPFIACEIFTCEIEVIIKIMVEDEEMMGLLFSFLDPGRPHGTLLAGYFSKVVICLLMRKTAAVMRYLKAHQEILKRLVDLISITSIMEVLIRLVGADDTIHSFHEDTLHWLADTDLLELLMDKLSPPNSSEAHANAADTLSAVSRLSQSELATKLSSPSFIARLFRHALEDQDSKSTLVHSLSVCISLLDPKRYVMVGMGRFQHVPDSSMAASPETIDGMLQRLGDLLQLLDVQNDERMLPTTYGELRPPLGTHRLKIVEFLAVLLRTNSEGARQELVRLGAIQLILKLFFDYPFNNLLHHHVENIIASCIESNNKMLIDHLLEDCNLVARLLQADENPFVLSSNNQPTIPASHKPPPRVGNLGHLTRIANRLLQAANSNLDIQAHLQEKPEWLEWQSEVLENRNSIENVCEWTCGRPTTLRDRQVDSDEDDFRDKDYDISTMASNLTREVFRYGFDNEDGDEGLGIAERDDDDVFFDDESAEVVISSLRFGEEQDSVRSKDSFLSGPNWFSFPEDRSRHSIDSFLLSTSASRFKDGQNNVSSPNSSSSDDEVVVGEDDDLVDTATSSESSSSQENLGNGSSASSAEVGGATNDSGDADSINNLSSKMENLGVLGNITLFQDENSGGDLFSARPPDWASWKDPSTLEGTSGRMECSDNNASEINAAGPSEAAGIPNLVPSAGEEAMQEDHRSKDINVGGVLGGHEDASTVHDNEDCRSNQVCEPLFDGGVQFVGVEIEGTAKAMEHALREGIVGEAGPIHPAKSVVQTDREPKANTDMVGDVDFSDVNYWKSNYSQSVTEVESL